MEIFYLSVKPVIYLISKNYFKRNSLFSYHLLIFSRANWQKTRQTLIVMTTTTFNLALMQHFIYQTKSFKIVLWILGAKVGQSQQILSSIVFFFTLHKVAAHQILLLRWTSLGENLKRWLIGWILMLCSFSLSLLSWRERRRRKHSPLQSSHWWNTFSMPSTLADSTR